MLRIDEFTRYEDVALQIKKNGYLPIPVATGSKNPAVKDWTGFVCKEEQIPKYAGYGCGILTGQAGGDSYPITAVDIDSTSAALVKDFTAWCIRRHKESCVRIGNPPKSLILYRTEEPGLRKVTGTKWIDRAGKVHRIEILGAGQHFVAYGMHPGTKKPYQWPSIGQPVEVHARELPVITADDIQAMVNKFDELAAGYGLKVYTPDNRTNKPLQDDITGFQPRLDWDREKARKHLETIPAEDRDIWIKVGMALHHEFDGGEIGLDLWDEWSATCVDKYHPGECIAKWESFGKRARIEVTAAYIKKLHNDIKKAREEREHIEAVRKAQLMIQDAQDPEKLIHSVIPDIAATAAQSTAADATLKKLIRDKYKRLTGTTLDKPVLKRLFSDPLSVPADFELTEIGNGERLRHKYGKRIMYCPELDTWYRWDGSRWCRCVPEYVLRLAKSVVQDIKNEAENRISQDEKDEVYKWAAQSATAKMLDNMVKLVRKEPGIMTAPDEMDADPRYIGVLNGTVDLHTGELMGPDRKRRITLNTGVKYDPEARCPVFEETVADSFFESTDMVDFLQRVIGYTLLGTPEKEEILVIPEGRGANGKSTIFNAIYHALGTYARFASADTFVSAKGSSASGAAREDVLRLMGSRFVYITEFEENGILKEAFIKGLTGGEAVPARGVYSRHTVEVMPTWVSFMPTNHLPIIKGEDEGIWRRIVTIPFKRDFSKDPLIKKDIHRKEKLKAEAPGILRWCVEGALKYLEEGLNPPREIVDRGRDYRRSMDLLSDWIEDCCTTGPREAAASRDLWNSFCLYTEREGLARYIGSSNALGRRLRDRGFKPVKSSHGVEGCGYVGISVKNPEL